MWAAWLMRSVRRFAGGKERETEEGEGEEGEEREEREKE